MNARLNYKKTHKRWAVRNSFAPSPPPVAEANSLNGSESLSEKETPL